MARYDVAVIGTGSDPDRPDSSGFAMGYHHAGAYRRLDACDLVACADVVPENAANFAEEFGVDAANVFEDHRAMLEALELDVVSICVPPAAHAEIAIDCAENAAVSAIHCEKPMATTWGESTGMVEAAEENDTQLTFNHQRRFGEPFRRAKELLDDGEIGDLERIEITTSKFYDFGPHSLDICNYFNDQRSAEWIIGQIDYREENKWFGTHNENQAFALWKYENGVFGVVASGEGVADAIACHHRLIGSDGTIEVGPGFDVISAYMYQEKGNPALRIRRDENGTWEEVPLEEPEFYRPERIKTALVEVVESLESGRPSQLRAENALSVMELIFGCYESARRRGRVEFPLDIDDNPLESMVAAGDLSPAPAPEE